MNGRTSSRDPNMQNNPKKSKQSHRIRELICAAPGICSASCDESRSELRFAADLSGDEEFEKIFSQGRDPHAEVALSILKRKDPNWDWKRWGKLSAREKELERRKAKCFHPSTEVLTMAGWKEMSNLSRGEFVYQAVPGNNSMALELAPVEILFKRHESKTLIHLYNEGMDLKVTPDHRMLGQRATGSFYVTSPMEMNRARRWWNAGISDNVNSIPESLLRVIIATQADGSYMDSGGVRFGFTKPWKIERLERASDTSSNALHREKAEIRCYDFSYK